MQTVLIVGQVAILRQGIVMVVVQTDIMDLTAIRLALVTVMPDVTEKQVNVLTANNHFMAKTALINVQTIVITNIATKLDIVLVVKISITATFVKRNVHQIVVMDVNKKQEFVAMDVRMDFGATPVNIDVVMSVELHVYKVRVCVGTVKMDMVVIIVKQSV